MENIKQRSANSNFIDLLFSPGTFDKYSKLNKRILKTQYFFSLDISTKWRKCHLRRNVREKSSKSPYFDHIYCAFNSYRTNYANLHNW